MDKEVGVGDASVKRCFDSRIFKAIFVAGATSWSPKGSGAPVV